MTLLLNLRPDGITRGDRLAIDMAVMNLPDPAVELVTEAMRSDAHRLDVAALVAETTVEDLTDFLGELWQWVPADSTLVDRFTTALDAHYGRPWHQVRDSA